MAHERSDTDLWSIVLAAGGSARLGEPKQLVRYLQRPLLAHALSLADHLTPGRVVVVLGAHAPRLRLLVSRHARRARTVVNGRWREGMACSLKIGLARLPQEARAALILLSDQPRLRRTAMHTLVARWRANTSRPVASRYSGRVGVPAVLPRRMWREARQLQGDVGARALLRDLDRLLVVSVPEAAIDVDTVADLAALGRR